MMTNVTRDNVVADQSSTGCIKRLLRSRDLIDTIRASRSLWSVHFVYGWKRRGGKEMVFFFCSKNTVDTVLSLSI